MTPGQRELRREGSKWVFYESGNASRTLTAVEAKFVDLALQAATFTAVDELYGKVIQVVSEWALAGHIGETGVTCEACAAIRVALSLPAAPAEAVVPSDEQIERLWHKHCHAVGPIALQDLAFARAVLALSPPAVLVEPAARHHGVYRHKKSGGLYELRLHAELESDQTPMVVYFSPDTLRTWVRPVTEFREKFEYAAAPAVPLEQKPANPSVHLTEPPVGFPDAADEGSGNSAPDMLPSMRDQNLKPPTPTDGASYQHGYSWGWNDCLRWISKHRERT